MKKDGEFQKSLIEYLEGCQKGEFLTGSMEYVKSKVPIDAKVQSKGIHAIFQKNSLQLIGNPIRIQLKRFLKSHLLLLIRLDKCTSDNAGQPLSHWWYINHK